MMTDKQTKTLLIEQTIALLEDGLTQSHTRELIATKIAESNLETIGTAIGAQLNILGEEIGELPTFTQDGKEAVYVEVLTSVMDKLIEAFQ